MTKQQAIKQLENRGWTFVRNAGRFSVVLCYPANSGYAEQEGVFDPRDLLESELEKVSQQSELRRKDGESQNEYLARLIFGEQHA